MGGGSRPEVGYLLGIDCSRIVAPGRVGIDNAVGAFRERWGLAWIGLVGHNDFPHYFLAGNNAVLFPRFGGHSLNDVRMPRELLALGGHIEGDTRRQRTAGMAFL
jgi:hypothetical protein